MHFPFVSMALNHLKMATLWLINAHQCRSDATPRFFFWGGGGRGHLAYRSATLLADHKEIAGSYVSQLLTNFCHHLFPSRVTQWGSGPTQLVSPRTKQTHSETCFRVGLFRPDVKILKIRWKIFQCELSATFDDHSMEKLSNVYLWASEKREANSYL